MLSNDKKITTADYWNEVYAGASTKGPLDRSDNKRPAEAFDRFTWVANLAEGKYVLGVASGHARIEQKIKGMHPTWGVLASDQAPHASMVTSFRPYEIFSAYNIPYPYKDFDTVICTQAIEYMEDQEAFFREAQRVGKKLLITVPLGEMEKWSQLRIYTKESVQELVEQFGQIEVFERQGDLLLVKAALYD